MASMTVNDLQELVPGPDSFLLGSVVTMPGVYTTAKVTPAGVVKAANLNTADWQTMTDLVSSTSSTWTTTTTAFNEKTPSWDDLLTTVQSNSALWSGVYATVAAFKPRWDAADIINVPLHTIVSTGSAAWNDVATTVISNSATWSEDKIKKHSQFVGDCENVSYNVVHNLGTTDVITQVYSVDDITNREVIHPTISIVNETTIRVTFNEPPPVNRYRVVVIG